MTKTQKEISAGGAVVRYVDGKWMVMLFSKKRGSLWCLPKGKIEEGETAEQAAKREVREETGVDADIVRHINDIHYWYVDNRRDLRLDKTVHFFLMKYLQVSAEKEDAEVEEIRWFDIDEAVGKASYESERETIEKAKRSLIEKGFDNEI